VKRILEVFLFAAAVALDLRALQSFLAGGVSTEFLATHAAAAGLSLVGIGWFLPREATGGTRWVVVGLLVPVVCLIPVLGVGMAGAFLFSAGMGGGINRFRERYKSLRELREDRGPGISKIGANLASIAEIMRTNDVAARRNATLALRNIDPVESLPILRRLSQDDDELVRLFALSERRLIVNEFEERSRVLANKRKEGLATVEDLMRLAESYIEEVEIGLPASQRQREALLSRALDVLWAARRQKDAPPDVELTILRCALLAYDTEVAERAFHRLDATMGEEDRLVLPRCEYFFQTSNWSGLLDSLRSLPDSLKSSPAMERVLSLWEPALSARKGGLHE